MDVPVICLALRRTKEFFYLSKRIRTKELEMEREGGYEVGYKNQRLLKSRDRPFYKNRMADFRFIV